MRSSLWLVLLALTMALALVSQPLLFAHAADADADDADGGDDGADSVIKDGGDDDNVESTEDDSDGDRSEAYDTEEDVLGPAPDVEVSFVFHEATDRKLKAGDTITLLVGLSNRGDSQYNISGIGAHLLSPFDFSFFIQNFTAQRVEGVVLNAGEQVSVAYQFRPDPQLEVTEYGFTAWIVYNNTAGREFLSTVYNGTVDLIEGSGSASLSSYATTAALLLLIGGSMFFFLNSKQQEKKPKSIERGTRPESDIEIYKPAEKSRKRK